jgi:hypothetical protein
MYMILFLIPFILAFILKIWLNTNTFIEYTDLFKLYKIVPHLKNYHIIREQGSDFTYLAYLSQFYDSFFVRLITCEICLGTWLSFISALILFPYLIQGGLLFYIFYTLALPYFTLLFYRILKKLK